MIDEDKGVKISTRFEDGKTFPECFVGKFLKIENRKSNF